MARRRDELDGQGELDLSQEPITWFEMSEITQQHEKLWIEWEQAKARTKELKARYDESYAALRAAFRRVRKSADQEARTLGTRALANRRIDPADDEA